MTFIILSLDAAPAERFGATEFQSAGQIDMFVHSKLAPYTPEVWVTVATRLPADEHDVTVSWTSEWRNPIFKFASKFIGNLPEKIYGTLGRLVRDVTGERGSLRYVDRETTFSQYDAVVGDLLGVTNYTDLQYAWDLMNVADYMPKPEFERKLLGACAEQFGWTREMLNLDDALARAQVYVFDMAGDVYTDNEAYRRVGNFVAELVEPLGDWKELLVLSVLGTHVEFLDEDADQDSRSYSWRVYGNETVNANVPESVFAVREWTETQIKLIRGDKNAIEVLVEQLSELSSED